MSGPMPGVIWNPLVVFDICGCGHRREEHGAKCEGYHYPSVARCSCTEFTLKQAATQ